MNFKEDVLRTNSHTTSIEQNGVRQSFEELERYIRSQTPARGVEEAPVNDDHVAAVPDDARRVGFEVACEIDR